MIVAMARVRVLAVEDRLDAVLTELQRTGTFEVASRPNLDGWVLGPSVRAGARATCEEAVRLLLARIEGLLELVPGHGQEPGTVTDGDDVLLASVSDEVKRLAPELEAAARRRDACHAERTTLPRHLAAIRRMLPFAPDPVALSGYETVLLWLDARHAEVLQDLRAHLASISGRRHDLIAARLDADSIGVLAIVPRQAAADLLALLGSLPIARVRLPEGYEGFTLPEAVAAMERRLKELESEEAGLDERIAGALEPVRARWSLAAQAARRHIVRLQAATCSASTGSVAVLEGWTPTHEVGALREALARVCPQAALEELPVPSGTEPPVLLDNAPPVRPFELLVRVVGLPRPSGVDPTPWLAAGLPFLIGLMVGDVGHGFGLAGLALALRGRRGTRPSWARDLGAAMLAAAAWAVGFGLVFGEVFGTVGRPPWWTPLFDRERALVPLLGAAVAFGFVHVALGHAIGVRAALQEGRGRLALERLGMVFLVLGAGSIAGAIARLLSSSTVPAGLAVVMLGIVAIVIGTGRKAALQAPLACMESAGHVLSYLRLAAIGLASVHLSTVATRLSDALPPWVGIPVAVALHGLCVVLAAFTPAVQALRLHYVEFFSGFHDGGGTPFSPLSFGSPMR